MNQPSDTGPRVALVTGATSGIGRAVAVRLGQDGMTVIVHGRDAGRGEAVVKEIQATGSEARFLAADLGDAASVAGLAATAGPVDVLFAANVRAAYQLVVALAPGMVARGYGSIISLDSMAGRVGLVGGAAYGATKAALTALSRSWAAEFSPAGVRVNTVAPGPVDTGVRGQSAVAGHPATGGPGRPGDRAGARRRGRDALGVVARAGLSGRSCRRVAPGGCRRARRAARSRWSCGP